MLVEPLTAIVNGRPADVGTVYAHVAKAIFLWYVYCDPCKTHIRKIKKLNFKTILRSKRFFLNKIYKGAYTLNCFVSN